MQLSQRPVEIELLLGQNCQLGLVAAPFGLGDLRAHVTQPTLDGPLVNLLNGALHLAFLGWFGLGQQRLGQQGPLRLVLDHVHGVASLAPGKRLQGRERAKMFKPCRLFGQRLDSKSPRPLEIGIVDGQGP